MKREVWSMVFRFEPDSSNNFIRTKVIEFIAKDNDDAKLKIFNICKKLVFRMRRSKWKYFIIQAMPLLNPGLDGNRLIRVKRQYCNRRILRIKNSEKILVQGYGPEALKKLGED